MRQSPRSTPAGQKSGEKNREGSPKHVRASILKLYPKQKLARVRVNGMGDREWLLSFEKGPFLSQESVGKDEQFDVFWTGETITLEKGNPLSVLRVAPPIVHVPESTPEELKENFKANPFGVLPYERRRIENPREPFQIESEPKRDYERMVAVVREVDGKRMLVNPRTGSVFLREDEQKGRKEESAFADVLKNPVGTLVAFEREANANAGWKTLEVLGKENTYAGELARLGYRIGRGRIPTPDVVGEIEKLEREGENIIQKELAPHKLVPAFKEGWREEYRLGENRVDFRDVWQAAVDPADAKDHDDIIGVHEERDDKGKIKSISYIISISDPLPFVPPNSAIEREAHERGTSVYPLGGVMPMLPEVISGGTDWKGKTHEGLASLVEKDRLTNSIVFTFSPNGRLLGRPFKCASVSKTTRSVSYERAQELLEGKKVEGESDRLASRLLRMLDRHAYREEAFSERIGKVELDSRKEWKLSNGKIVEHAHYRMNEVVEAFMVMANSEFGKRLDYARQKLGIPGFFRTHDKPDVQDIRAAAAELKDEWLVAMCDEYAGGHPSAEFYENVGKMDFENFAMNHLLKQGKESKDAIATLAKKGLLKRAGYGLEPGHFGTGRKKYAWFTSPMRRFADIEGEQLDRARQLMEQGVSPKDIRIPKERDIMELGNHLADRDAQAAAIEELSQRMWATEQLISSVGKEGKVLISHVVIYKGEVKGALVQVRFPNTEFVQEYFLKPDEFKGFPTKPFLAMQFKGGKPREVRVKLLSANVGEGQISLELLDTSPFPEVRDASVSTRAERKPPIRRA